MKKEAYSDFALHYKKRIANSFIALGFDDIDAKIAGKKFYASRKYDGQLVLLYFDGNDLCAFNSNGKPLPQLPVFSAAAIALKAAKVKNAAIAAELYVDETSGRKRVGDVNKAIADKKSHNSLCLALFDIAELDGKAPAGPWAEIYAGLKRIFGTTAKCHPVMMQEAVSKDELRTIFSQWVTTEGAEGIVVRSELPLVYKLKSRYTIDTALIGFSESPVKGRIRCLLFALMLQDGSYQVIAHSGNGLEEDQRTKLFTELSKKTVPSSYIHTDSNHAAFHMVSPEKVAEISAIDITTERGDEPIMNPCLVFENGSFRSVGSMPGVSLIAPVFSRWRNDKTVNKDDLRLAQIADFLPEVKAGKQAASKGKTGLSKALRREVYKKEGSGKLMVQKFLLWKTNKEQDLRYPAFVFSYSNFSTGRADPFQTDVRITNDEKQAHALFDSFVTGNVKKGWEKC